MKKEMHFPIIKNEQVVLLRSDYNTGHVLDNSYQLHIGNDQKMYTIFNSIKAAKTFIKNEQKKWKYVEFTIYDKNNTLIYESIME